MTEKIAFALKSQKWKKLRKDVDAEMLYFNWFFMPTSSWARRVFALEYIIGLSYYTKNDFDFRTLMPPILDWILDKNCLKQENLEKNQLKRRFFVVDDAVNGP